MYFNYKYNIFKIHILYVFRGLMLNKISTDDNLVLRGCCLPSMCSLCCKFPESSFHLFFECSYAARIWSQFASVINMRLVFQTVEEMWSLCNRSWNPQCKLVITATMINILNSIWYARNQVRFSNKNNSLAKLHFHNLI